MDDDKKKLSKDGEVKSNLFADIAGLAHDENMDSSDFLKSLTDLIESDEYEEVADEIIGEEDPELLLDEDSPDLDNYYENPLSESDYNNELNYYDEPNLNDELEFANGSDVNEKLEFANDSDVNEELEFADNSDYNENLNSEEFESNNEFNSENDFESEDELKYDNQFSETNPALNAEEISTVENAGDVSDEVSGDEQASMFLNEISTDEISDDFTKEDEDDTDELLENIEGSDVPPPANKRKRMIYNLIMVACILVFVYCVARIGIYYYTGYVYNNEMSDLQDIVGDIATAPVIVTSTDDDIFFPDEQVYASIVGDYNDQISDSWAAKYQTLHDLNSDCIGWLYIPDTNINYPVMYTPEQYDKYLYKDLEGNYLFRGLPFMAEGTLLNESQNYLIYGHNMRDGSAFHDLRYYLEDDWATEHKYCYLNTAYGEGIYELMDVVITKIYTTADTCFKYYKYTGNLTEEEFNTYVSYMGEMSSYDSGFTATYGEELVTLSTCYKIYDDNGRLVVVFKRIQ
jgi:sortase B